MILYSNTDMKENRQLDDFFHSVSRFIIIVPIIIVVVAIFLKLVNGTSRQKGFKEYSLTPTPTKSQNIIDSLNMSKKSSPSAKFNFTGPLVCDFTSDVVNVNAYVKNKRIYIKMDEKNIISNYLLNGDCVYIWKNGTYSGEKVCGISQQVSIFEGLLASGFLDPNMIFGSLGKLFNLPSIGGSQDTLKSAMSTCKNEEVPETIKFDIPKNVLFKNKVLK
ncbi:hypothetical protein A2767_04465 [Candidatus Roizmanbacteria bacterium RIFCSPHIGHO2_01_FULL_35_10]|uniref:Uncharacterized protein n=1 Tax=Candidatus Roizmanbacteria bacterium RIFCSPLOWO2_01_FULL_35_13 TaxID=1802055 RepID=A0A1F7IH05_9BACT|nr:MAG: hypothetical protein A2767_04465 [Candidatus Roizmanbacteria bacterium RIFCSPHIGHO2_01_FULL_35_10]OGK42652.1 MAG: hypothetical protein A3A74_06485 [Candidatus Roizmanbacteria bacterium RIFCSPLOWO2_01_FULL_35_13]